MMCPQLSPIRPVFSRVLRPCLRGAYIRILPASEMGLSCGQRAHFSALFLCPFGGMLIEKIPIVPEIMRIDTRTQAIDMQQIGNRRFLFNPKTGVLVLGRQYQETSLVNASHAVELADAGITKDFDDFVRGWIGTGRNYPKGVIHFAPCVDSGNISLFDRAFDTLEMFRENGALAGTVVRGFGSRWEQPLSAILTDLQKEEQKPSLRQQLRKTPEGKAVRHRKENQQQR